MPRPGPRPYECVRRAWHSDRHQPMRSSIVQQIFKVVYEHHSAATKKNREWREKLPTVVLRTEEIMYSKANSEAEYLDLGTLWDRVNDAIDTIIRRDESTETGELLPPCVEAALNLGCVPVRASRSQRHNNPRNYLNPRAQEPVSPASMVSDGNSTDQNRNLLLLRSGNQSILERSANGNSIAMDSGSNRHFVPNMNCPPTSLCKKSYSPANNQIGLNNRNTSLNLGSVYPLYYGTNFQPKDSWPGVQEPQNSKEIIVGRPIFASAEKPAEFGRRPLLTRETNEIAPLGCLRPLLPRETNEIAPDRIKPVDFGEKNAETPDTACDLSLRLGLCSDATFCRGKGLALDSEKIDSGKYGGIKATVISSSREKEFSVFPIELANDPSGFHLARYTSEGEDQSVGAFLRKRKLPIEGNVDSRQFFWQVKPTSYHFADSMRKHNS